MDANAGVFLNSVDQAKDICADHRDLASGLDHARTADQALARRWRQQIQFVFCRQRRLAARRHRGDSGGIVHQESRDAAVKQVILLQQLRPPIYDKRA